MLATSYNWSTTCGSISGPNNLSAISVDWPGSFAGCVITVSAINACGTGIPRTLSVLGAPGMPAVITGNTAPCAGAIESYTTAGSTGATDYFWTFPAGSVLLGGQGTTNLTMQWGSTSGNVTVRASNACGNSGVRSLACTISCRMNQVNTTNENFKAEVYPNPTNGKITLKYNSLSAENLLLIVNDIEGRNLISENLSSVEGINIHEVDLSSFSKGLYVVQLRGTDIN
jgi:hypothetical protein